MSAGPNTYWERYTLAGRDPETLSPELRLRFRTVSIGLMIFPVVMVGYLTWYALAGTELPRVISGVLSLLYCPLLYIVLWRTGRPVVVSFGIVAGFLVLSLHDAILMGGVGAPAYAWVSVTPLLAGLIQGKRPGLMWWGVCAVVTAVLLAWGHLSGAPPPQITAEQFFSDGVGEMVGLLVMSGAALVFYTRVIERQTTELTHTVDCLEAEVDVRRAAEVAAQAADEAKSAFLATMSHEVRTPMNGVIGMTDLLLESPLAPEQREFAETIRASANTLLVILNDILDLSKSEAGHLVLEHIPVRPSLLVQEVGKLMQDGAHRKGLVLSTRIDPSVPEWVIADPHRLRQMLTNLAANALKFTHEGQMQIVVIATPGTQGSQYILRFEVIDTGIGIDQDRVAGLFAPFVQADSSMARKYGGTGLGLTIVRSLAEKMNGRAGADSAPGKGSTFWFEVPVDSTEPTPTPEMTLNPLLESIKGRRVMVVEDNPVNQRVVSYMLDKLDVGFVIAGDGQQALRLLDMGTVDAILMDCQMPVMDGYEATREIRAKEAGSERHVPIIGLTAHALPGDRVRAEQAGMDDYLTKPLKKVDLEAALTRAFAAAPAIH